MHGINNLLSVHLLAVIIIMLKNGIDNYRVSVDYALSNIGELSLIQ